MFLNNCDYPAYITALGYAIGENCSLKEITYIIALVDQLRSTLTSLLVCKEINSLSTNSTNENATLKTDISETENFNPLF